MTSKDVAMKKKKAKWTREDIIFHVITCSIYIAFALICFYPFWYLFINTISNNQLTNLGKVLWVPIGVHWDNYVKVLKTPNLGSSALVTVGSVICSTVLHVLVTSFAAYCFTKEEMWHKKFWYRMVIATMYFSAGLIPAYLFWSKFMNLDNSFWIYVLPGCLGVYNMVLIKTSMEAVPAELEESAYMDGAGYLIRYGRIFLTLQKPILSTVVLFHIVGAWNDFFTTKLYITKPALYKIQFVLYEMLNQVSALKGGSLADETGIDMSDMYSPVAIRNCLTIVVIVPVMCVYPFIQKYYVKGVMLGAVKG